MDMERKIKRGNEWKKENTFRMMIQLNKENDKEIIEALLKSGNKNGFIKEALLEYIKK